jgi:hypothetical protein
MESGWIRINAKTMFACCTEAVSPVYENGFCANRSPKFCIASWIMPKIWHKLLFFWQHASGPRLHDFSLEVVRSHTSNASL